MLTVFLSIYSNYVLSISLIVQLTAVACRKAACSQYVVFLSWSSVDVETWRELLLYGYRKCSNIVGMVLICAGLVHKWGSCSQQKYCNYENRISISSVSSFPFSFNSVTVKINK